MVFKRGVLALVVAFGACLARPAPVLAFEPLYDNLNVIERTHVDELLTERGLVRDTAPGGQRFGEVIIATLDVFREDTAWLMWANALHATTRAWIIEDELLWESGAPFDTALVEETVRNLRLSPNVSVVAMIPVESAEVGVVDILAVTRDTWSLRLSTELDASSGGLNRLFLALSERNLLGAHKHVALIGIYEPDTLQLGPRYIDPRLFRSRLTLTEQLLFAINHDTGELEGTVNTFELGLPLYSLDSEWGFSVSETHNILVDRLFIGDELRVWDDPETTDEEAVPFALDTTELDVRALVFRGFGRAPRHIVSFGYGLSINDFDLAATDVAPEVAEAFEAANLPRDERASFLVGRYRFFSGEFAVVQNYQTYGFAEDLAVGYDTRAEVRLGPELLGSDNDFVSWSAELGYTALVPTNDAPEAALDGAVLTATIEVGARFEVEGSEWIDRFFFASARVASPRWGPIRVHLGGTTFVKQDRVTTGLVELGGSNGLRGYTAGAFLGESYALGHLEVRTMAVELLTLRLGGVVFFDAGTIWSEGTGSELLSDVGLGARLVVPQAQRFVYRFDYAFPTSGPEDALPGTFTVGVEQVF